MCRFSHISANHCVCMSAVLPMQSNTFFVYIYANLFDFVINMFFPTPLKPGFSSPSRRRFASGFQDMQSHLCYGGPLSAPKTTRLLQENRSVIARLYNHYPDFHLPLLPSATLARFFFPSFEKNWDTEQLEIGHYNEANANPSPTPILTLTLTPAFRPSSPSLSLSLSPSSSLSMSLSVRQVQASIPAVGFCPAPPVRLCLVSRSPVPRPCQLMPRGNGNPLRHGPPASPSLR